MAKLRLEIELEYDADVMHNEDCVADKKWFFDDILMNSDGQDYLTLYSDIILDSVGTVRVLRIIDGA